MQREFIYTEPFKKSWQAMGLSDDNLTDLEDILLENPHEGDAVPGLSGMRKMRIQLSGHGKRGGARVIYLDIFSSAHTYFLFAYPKNVQENLTPQQEKALFDIVKRIKGEEGLHHEK